MEKKIEFRDCAIPYLEEYDRYAILKSGIEVNYMGRVFLGDYDSQEFLILANRKTDQYTIGTWLLAHFIGAPMEEIVGVVKTIASTLSYHNIPELVNDSKFLK